MSSFKESNANYLFNSFFLTNAKGSDLYPSKPSPYTKPEHMQRDPFSLFKNLDLYITTQLRAFDDLLLGWPSIDPFDREGHFWQPWRFPENTESTPQEITNSHTMQHHLEITAEGLHLTPSADATETKILPHITETTTLSPENGQPYASIPLDQLDSITLHTGETLIPTKTHEHWSLRMQHEEDNFHLYQMIPLTAISPLVLGGSQSLLNNLFTTQKEGFRSMNIPNMPDPAAILSTDGQHLAVEYIGKEGNLTLHVKKGNEPINIQDLPVTSRRTQPRQSSDSTSRIYHIDTRKKMWV